MCERNIPEDRTVRATPEVPDEVGRWSEKVPPMSPKADGHARFLSKEDILEMRIVRNFLKYLRRREGVAGHPKH